MRKYYSFCFLWCLISCNTKLNTVEVRHYYDTGKEKLKEKFYVTNDNKRLKQGTYTSYYENGQYQCTMNYQAGKMEGEMKRYYESGKGMSEQCTYHNNLLEGERKLFYENGKVLSVSHHQHDLFEGIYRSYYETGKLKEEGNYVKNKMEGTWKYYYDSGELKEIVVYAGGSENGPYQSFYKGGKIKALGFYKNEKEDSLWKFYYETGELLEEGTYRYGMENGILKQYDKSGKLIKEINYLNGIPVEYNDYEHNSFSKHKVNKAEAEKIRL